MLGKNRHHKCRRENSHLKYYYHGGWVALLTHFCDSQKLNCVAREKRQTVTDSNTAAAAAAADTSPWLHFCNESNEWVHERGQFADHERATPGIIFTLFHFRTCTWIWVEVYKEITQNTEKFGQIPHLLALKICTWNWLSTPEFSGVKAIHYLPKISAKNISVEKLRRKKFRTIFAIFGGKNFGRKKIRRKKISASIFAESFSNRNIWFGLNIIH